MLITESSYFRFEAEIRVKFAFGQLTLYVPSLRLGSIVGVSLELLSGFNDLSQDIPSLRAYQLPRVFMIGVTSLGGLNIAFFP